MSESEMYTPSVRRRPLNLKYKEILRLSEMLARAQIPHVLERLYDGWKLAGVGDNADGWAGWDVVEHFISYGHEADRLEILGLLTEAEERIFDGVMGYMTAEDVFERIKARHEGR